MHRTDVYKRQVQNTVRASADSLDAAAKDSIKGSLNVLDKSLSVLDSTSSMRKAGRTMKAVSYTHLDVYKRQGQRSMV